MAPKDDPELIMLCCCATARVGGLLPMVQFRCQRSLHSVMKNSLQYLQIKPSDQKIIETVPNPNVIGLSVDEATNKLTEKGMKVVVVGNGSNI